METFLLSVLQHSSSSHHHRCPQDLPPMWDMHLCDHPFRDVSPIPWKGVTVQSDAIKYCFKAVQDISSILSLLDTFDSLSLVWLASFCVSGLLCLYQGQQILRNGG